MKFLITLLHVNMPAFACEELADDNHLAYETTGQMKQYLDALEARIVAQEQLCTKQGLDLAKTTESIVSGIGCHGQKENAVLTTTLQIQAENCATELEEIRSLAEDFSRNGVGPFSSDLETARGLDLKALEEVPDECLQESGEFEKINERAKQIASRAVIAHGRVRSSAYKFSDMAKSAKKISGISQEALRKCPKENGEFLAHLPTLQKSRKPSSTRNANRQIPGHMPSTVTGVTEDKEKRISSESIISRQEKLTLSLENAQGRLQESLKANPARPQNGSLLSQQLGEGPAQHSADLPFTYVAEAEQPTAGSRETPISRTKSGAPQSKDEFISYASPNIENSRPNHTSFSAPQRSKDVLDAFEQPDLYSVDARAQINPGMKEIFDRAGEERSIFSMISTRIRSRWRDL